MYYSHNQPSYRTVPPTVVNGIPKQNEIRVTGEGTISVQPDQADITIGVITENIELKVAQSENTQITSNVIQSLTNIGISNENIKTVDYSIYPLYDYIDGKQTFKGYKVEHRLNVTVNDISKVGLVVDTAVDSGANSISNISFSVTNPNIPYQQALALALNHATQKAMTIANTYQVQLRQPPILITEGIQTQLVPVPYTDSPAVKGVATTPIEPGQLEIKANVTVVYAFYQ